MRIFYVFFICLIALVLGCKSDKNVEKQKEKDIIVSKKLSESEMLQENIQDAYNLKKYTEEEQVKFKINLKVQDSIYFDGYLSVKTDNSKIRILSSQIDKVMTFSDESSNIEKMLFWASEIYTLPFSLKEDNFELLKRDDEFIISKYVSSSTDSEYKVYSNPITNIIEKVEYITPISIQPFDKGVLYFDKYITVNRIPVAMHWNIKKDGDNIAVVKISRISYPDNF